MLKIGLTGGIGSGKSLVADLFTHLDIPIYNADQRAKKIMTDNIEVRENLIQLFGEKVYTKTSLNRKYLADIVFNNPDKLKTLNSIVHPAVRKDYNEWHNQQNASYTIREAAILFESGAYEDCDKIIAVNAEESLRVKRVVKRDGVTEEEVKRRIDNQWSDEQRTEKSDYMINNNEKEMLLPQVLKIHDILLEIVKVK